MFALAAAAAAGLVTLILLTWLLGRWARTEAARLITLAISVVFATLVALLVLDRMGGGGF